MPSKSFILLEGEDEAAMSKGPSKLVIVESPAKARTINKYLGSDYLVQASMGHVRDLPKSRMGIDVENNFQPRYIIPSKSKKTVGHLKKTAKGKDTIYLAPDPDREGEAISWHLASILGGANRKIKRVIFNEITSEAVRKAFEHPRDIDLRLVNAQQARRVLDRIVGYNLSPLLWSKVGSGLSAGRVQSVALRLVVEREREIRAFKPVEYWSIQAILSSLREEVKSIKFAAKLDKIKGEKAEIDNERKALEIKKILEGETFQTGDIEQKERRRKPTPPFTTSKLQQEAYSKLGFTAARTMQIAQSLYEGIDLGTNEERVGLITYMRTDSVTVSDGALKEVRKFIQTQYGKDYLPDSPNQFKARKGAQEAHEAIRPSSVLRTPDKVGPYLSKDELRLYELIWRKFVASQMPEAVDQMINISIHAGKDHLFKATGTKNIFPGFLIVYDWAEQAKAKKKAQDAEEGENNEEENRDLPALIKGEKLHRHEIWCRQHFTKPPARFNDASLVKVLEEKGIGRPSTYAPIVTTILARGYTERRSSALSPTELGEVVVDLLVQHFPKILDYEFTANMEEELDRVEEGDLEWTQVIRDFYEPFSIYLQDAKRLMPTVKQPVEETDHKCDVCGKIMVIRKGRFGRFLACSGFPACKYTKSIPTGFRCPNEGCNGDLIQRRSKRGRMFYGCSNYPKCNYVSNQLPEKVPSPEPSGGNPSPGDGRTS